MAKAVITSFKEELETVQMTFRSLGYSLINIDIQVKIIKYELQMLYK